MNIFFTDEHPTIAARNLCDDHVVSQFKETIQMLVAAALLRGADPDAMPLTLSGRPHRGGYKDHPCTRWASENPANWNWLCDHGLAIGEQFRMRFDNDTSILHDQIRLLAVSRDTILSHFDEEWGMTEPARALNQSIGENLDLLGDDLTTVEAYRLYYQRDKRSFAEWKYTPAPDWF